MVKVLMQKAITRWLQVNTHTPRVVKLLLQAIRLMQKDGVHGQKARGLTQKAEELKLYTLIPTLLV
jgi:hypothetical protein